MSFPDDPVQIGVDGKDVVGASSENKHFLEAKICDQKSVNDGRGKGIQSLRLIVGRVRVEELKTAHVLLGE
jgi:hypothetical protein